MGRQIGGQIGSDEARLVEMSGRIFSRLVPAYVAVGSLILIGSSVYGWLPFILLLIEATKMFLSHQIAKRGYAPARVYLFAQYSSPVFLGAAVFLTGGIASPYIVISAVHGDLFPSVFQRRHERYDSRD